MKVVSNTSPLIALAKLERLSILAALFQSIMIPQGVQDEFLQNCTVAEETLFRATCQQFIRVSPVRNLWTFSRRLDQGEQEALTLALREKADLLLLDDRKAFNEAQEQRIIVASTRAILKMAEEKQIIASSQELEKSLRTRNFFLPKY